MLLAIFFFLQVCIFYLKCLLWSHSWKYLHHRCVSCSSCHVFTLFPRIQCLCLLWCWATRQTRHQALSRRDWVRTLSLIIINQTDYCLILQLSVVRIWQTWCSTSFLAFIFLFLFSKEDKETGICKLQFTHDGLKSCITGGGQNQKGDGASSWQVLNIHCFTSWHFFCT